MVKLPSLLIIGPMDHKIYLVRAYKEFGVNEDGTPKYISNWRENLTDQAIALVFRHIDLCEDEECLCKQYAQRT